MTGTLWITGAAGFSGRHMAAYAAALPERPRIIGLDGAVRRLDLPLDDFVRVDLTDSARVSALARQHSPDWVVHLAGSTTAGPDLWRSNVGTTLGLAVGLASSAPRARFLSIGSAAEYAPGAGGPLDEDAAAGPVSDYGRSKLAQTLLTLGLPARFGLQALVARTFNLVGPGLPPHLVAGRLCDQFARVGPHGCIELHNQDTSRDFVDVRDAVDAYWRLVRDGAPGIYNVCSGRATSVRRLVELCAQLTGKRPAVRTTQTRDASADPDVVVGAPTKIAAAVGWAARLPLEQSLGDMLQAIAAADAGAVKG
jgi:GDP-4-dehydro-6-deoxy-D-mannose reductase